MQHQGTHRRTEPALSHCQSTVLLTGSYFDFGLVVDILEKAASFLEVSSCTPLRRHSWSAPAGLLLEGCLSRVASLSRRVDRVRDQVRQSGQGRSSELDTWATDQIVESVLDGLLSCVIQSGESSNMSKSRQCHHCHRPLSHPEHDGIGAGVNQCTLEHFDLCPGGRKTSKDWTGCPVDDSDETEYDSSDRKEETSGLNETNVRKESLKETDDDSLLKHVDPIQLAKSLLDIVIPPETNGEDAQQALAKTLLGAGRTTVLEELLYDDGDDEEGAESEEEQIL